MARIIMSTPVTERGGEVTIRTMRVRSTRGILLVGFDTSHALETAMDAALGMAGIVSATPVAK